MYASSNEIFFPKPSFETSYDSKSANVVLSTRSSFDVCNGYPSEMVECNLYVDPESCFGILVEGNDSAFERAKVYETNLTFCVEPMSYVTIPLILRVENKKPVTVKKGFDSNASRRNGAEDDMLRSSLRNDYRYDEDTGEYIDWVVLSVKGCLCQ